MKSPDMRDILICVICGRKLLVRDHVDTCSQRCFKRLLARQREENASGSAVIQEGKRRGHLS